MDSSSSSSPDDAKVEELLALCSDESLLKLSLNTHSFSSTIAPLSPSPFSSSPPLESVVLNTDLLVRLQRLKTPPSHPTPGNNEAQASQHPQVPAVSSRIMPDPDEVDVLGADLAARLAALKASSTPSASTSSVDPPIESQEAALPSVTETSTLGGDGISGSIACAKQIDEGNTGIDESLTSVVSDVERLLASVSDQVKLEKKNNKQKGKVPDDDNVDEANDVEEEISDSDVDQVVEWAKDAARLDVSDNEQDDEPVLDEKVQDDSISPPSESLDPAKKKSKGWKLW